jgi:hypothetical protein
MKAALSRILEFFVGHDRREKNHPVHRSYCICGALKPEGEGREGEASLKTSSRPQGQSRQAITSSNRLKQHKQKMISTRNRSGGRGMKQILSLLTAAAIAATMTNVAFAQVGGKTSRVDSIAANGNTTIVFEPANDSDLQMGLLTRWSSFAQVHQQIAHQLGDKPMLIEDAGYLRKHPELEKLFQDNPKLLAAMKRNPGNFVANQPRSEE